MKLAPRPRHMPVMPCAATVWRTTSKGPEYCFGKCSGCTSCSWSLHLIVSVGCATEALQSQPCSNPLRLEVPSSPQAQPTHFVHPAKRPAMLWPRIDSLVPAGPSSIEPGMRSAKPLSFKKAR